MFEHPITRDVIEFRNRLVDIVFKQGVSIPIELHSSDDASGNDKFDAHYLQSVQHAAMRYKCSNHQANLILMVLYTTIGLDIMHGLFAATKFLLMGPYYLRCIMCVRRHGSHSYCRIDPPRSRTDSAPETNGLGGQPKLHGMAHDRNVPKHLLIVGGFLIRSGA